MTTKKKEAVFSPTYWTRCFYFILLQWRDVLIIYRLRWYVESHIFFFLLKQRNGTQFLFHCRKLIICSRWKRIIIKIAEIYNKKRKMFKTKKNLFSNWWEWHLFNDSVQTALCVQETDQADRLFLCVSSLYIHVQYIQPLLTYICVRFETLKTYAKENFG